MKKILLFLFIIVSINGLAQFPATQSMATANTRLQVNGAVDARKGLINGVYTDTTAANADQIDFYDGSQIWTTSDRNFWLRSTALNMWLRIAKYSDVGSVPNLQQVTDVGNTTTNSIIVDNANIDAIGGSSFRVKDDNGNVAAILWYNANDYGELRLKAGVGTVHFIPQLNTSDNDLYLPKTGNANDTLATLYDIRAGGGSGTPGGSDKQVQFNDAGAFGGSAGFETALTNLRAKITAQATTEVPLEIKLASSQTANALNISSSAGTGDLAYIEADGDIVLTNSSGKQITGTGTELALRQTGDALGESGLKMRNRSGSAGGVFYNAALDLVDIGFLASSAVQFNFRYEHRNGEILPANTSGEFQFFRSDLSTPFARFGIQENALYGFEGTDAILNLYADDGDDGVDKWVLKSTIANDFTLTNNSDIRLKLGSNGALNLGAYPGSFTGTVNKMLAVESDGDVIVKDAISLNKGVFIASPTSADTIDVWQTPVAITITSLKAILRGSSSPSVTYNIGFGTNIQSPTAVFTADATCTSITTGCSNSSGFNDATIPAGSFIWVYTTASSGTIRSIAFTINYTED